MRRLITFLTRKNTLIHAGIVLACLIAAFLIALKSPYMIDDPIRLHHSRYVLASFGLGPHVPDIGTRYYAPLFELLLGIATDYVFFWVKDPVWIRHSFTLFAHFFGLHILFILLRRAGISKAGSLLAIAVMAAQIRLTGQALFNMKDAPGAMSYLLSAAAIWCLLKDGQDSGRFTYRRIVSLGIIGVIPFLIRSPLLTPLPFALTGLATLLILRPKLRRGEDIFFPALLCISAGCAFIVLVSPYMWTAKYAEWIQPFFFFKDFPFWNDVLIAFGKQWPLGKVPWWYVFAWIPTEVPPAVLAIIIAGSLMPLVRKKAEPAIEYPIGRRTIRVTMLRWMWVYTIVSWAAFIVIRPKVYEEDRHLLFLFPPLFLACVLGLDRLSNRMKYALMSIVIIAATSAYGRWGGYSYAYKSALLYPQDPSGYQGDFRFICNGNAIAAMLPFLTEDTRISVPNGTADPLILKTLQESLVRGNPAFNRLSFIIDKKNAMLPYYALSMKSQIPPMKKRIENGEVELVYEERMPDGTTACLVTKITANP